MHASTFITLLLASTDLGMSMGLAQDIDAASATCPATVPKGQQVLTQYFDALFSQRYQASLDLWVPNGTWWTLGTKAFVPWAGFSTIEEHLPIMEKTLAPFTTTDWYPWNWVVSDDDKKLTAEFWLDWRGPNGLQYQTNATVTVKFDKAFKIAALHEYLDLTQQPTVVV